MSRRLVHRLLSGRRALTRGEKADLIAAVMQQVDAGPPPPRRFAPLLALGGAAAAALLLVPLAMRRDDDSPAAFAPRGGATSATFSAFCAAGPCRAGDTLLFDLQPGDWRYFA